MTHPAITHLLRQRWSRLRLYRTSGSVLVDYKIMQNYARRLLRSTPK